MDETTLQSLRSAWYSMSEDIRKPPASEEELCSFEAEFGPVPPVFRRFLAEFGGGVVGSEWVNGIADLARSHRKFREEFGPPRGWTMAGVFIIGWDGAGNPFGIEVSSGRVLVEDHDFGGIHEMAPSFEAFLVEGILRPVDTAEPSAESVELVVKPEDCEALGMEHVWFNIDDVVSGCYNCQVVRAGQLWRRRPRR